MKTISIISMITMITIILVSAARGLEEIPYIFGHDPDGGSWETGVTTNPEEIMSPTHYFDYGNTGVIVKTSSYGTSWYLKFGLFKEEEQSDGIWWFDILGDELEVNTPRSGTSTHNWNEYRYSGSGGYIDTKIQVSYKITESTL